MEKQGAGKYGKTAATQYNETSNYRSTTSRKDALHFFQIVFNNKRMGIPKKFVRKYGYGENVSDNNSTILLEVPTGETQWPVELAKDDVGKFRLFEKGWKEFCDHFSLSHGNFLVFRHEGNSTFQVIIFDITASEIAYPLDPSAESSDDASVEIIDGSPLQQETRNKRAKQAPDLQIKEEDDGDGDVSVEILEDYPSSQMKNEKTQKSCNFQPFASSTTRGRSKALERAQALNPKNPSFIVVIHPSYIDPGYQISIQSEFVKKYVNKNCSSVKISRSGGRIWTVKINGLKLSIGWKRFAQDNNLKIGDVCVFELINRDDNTLEVFIFRAYEED